MLLSKRVWKCWIFFVVGPSEAKKLGWTFRIPYFCRIFVYQTVSTVSTMSTKNIYQRMRVHIMVQSRRVASVPISDEQMIST